MEIDKLTSPIKEEEITKEREIVSQEEKRKETILKLKALYEAYYFEKKHSIKNAYKLSIQTEQFKFNTFLEILCASGIIVTLIISMFTMRVNVAANIFSIMPPSLFLVELILLVIIDYFATGLFLKFMLCQSQSQKIASEYILEEMIIHRLITKDELKANGIEFEAIKNGFSPRIMKFTYNDSVSHSTEK